MILTHPCDFLTPECGTPAHITCPLGTTNTSAVDCMESTIHLPAAGNCSLTPSDVPLSYVDFNTTVSCPLAQDGPVSFPLRVNFPQPWNDSGCGPATTFVWVKNPRCLPSVEIACIRGTSASNPVLCSEAGDRLTPADAAGCTLSGLGAVWSPSISVINCPPSGQAITVTLTAVASPYYGDNRTCGPVDQVIHIRNDSKWWDCRWVWLLWATSL